MLKWYSVDYSDKELSSPLFLTSVSLKRESVRDPDRHDYIISSDDEVILNPALRKKLESEYGIELPADQDVSLVDLEETAEAIRELIQAQQRWRITNKVILGIFDFAKLSLYNDLEEQRNQIKSNSIVQALNGDTSALNADASSAPSADQLDDAVDPIDTYQVLEADSSQQEAIEAAKAGVSFVLQGPPGTGKSQTIANIISEKLAAGENILFVSEKQAALDVVKNRLDEVGLGRFCLPVHGKKANKDEVLSHLERELNSSLIKEVEQRPQELGRLRKRRAELNEYGDLLSQKFGELGIDAYDAHGRLSIYQDTPAPSWNHQNPFSISSDELETAIDCLERLAQYDEQITHYRTHPWSHITLDDWRVDTTDRMRSSIEDQQAALEELIDFTNELDESLGLKITSISAFEDIIQILELLNSRPEIDWTNALFQPEFYRREDQLATLAERNQQLADLQETIDESYGQRSTPRMAKSYIPNSTTMGCYAILARPIGS